MRNCPTCSTPMDKIENARIGTPEWFLPTDSHGFALRSAQPVVREHVIMASFYACPKCEHCETVGKVL